MIRRNLAAGKASDQMANQGGKNVEQKKTIERLARKGCPSSGLLMWLTFRSLIILPGQR
jgi:hypothetical protein